MRRTRDSPSAPWRSTTRLLTKSFFRRFFENDILPDGVDLRDSLAWILPLFAAPPMFIALKLFPKYSMVAFVSEMTAAYASWSDKVFFIGYAMTTMGLVTVLVWDSLFPDRRDAMILGSLPVRTTTVVSAKLVALFILVLGFALAVNTPVSLVFAFAAGGANAADFARTLIAHLTTTLSSSLFVFSTLVFVQASLALVLPQRALRWVAVTAQLVFVVLILEWFAFSPGLLERLTTSASSLNRSGLGDWLPPLWYLGLYEVIVGTEHDQQALLRLANRAIVATGGALVLAVTSYAACYRLRVERALSNPEPSPKRPGPLKRLTRNLLFSLYIKTPIERAIFNFVAFSLARSRRHRLIIAVYLGVALAFVLGGFLGPWMREPANGVDVSQPSVMLLSIPLILSFFVLVGLRVLFAIPTSLEANWIFRMTEQDDKVQYATGVRKVVAALGLAPVAAATLPLYWALWGPTLAFAHTLYWWILARLLMEGLLFSFRQIPFTCAYLPGKANVKLLWPIYLGTMLIYAYSSSRIELWLFQNPYRWLASTAFVAALVLAFALYRRLDSSTAPFDYQERVEAEIQTLPLSPYS